MMTNRILKFGFNSLLREAEKNNWTIPTMEQVKEFEDMTHTVVWVSNIPELEEDRATHALIYDRVNDVMEICNKKFMQNVVVIKNRHESI